MDEPVLVLDNGAYQLRGGFSGEAEPRVCMPNYTGTLKRQCRTLIGDEAATDVKDQSQLFVARPFDRGYIVNWPCQQQLWDRMLATHLEADAKSSSLLLTTPPIVPTEIADNTHEVLFEEYGFQRVLCVPAAECAALRHAQLQPDSSFATSGCGLVVDSGFSFTHAVPVVNRRAHADGVVRLDVGGKLLTNYLKELVSYRQWNMMEDTEVVNQVKEALCFVSQNFDRELALCDPLSRRRNGALKAARPLSPSSESGGEGEEASAGGAAPGAGAGAGAGAGSKADGLYGISDNIRAEFVLPDYKVIMKGFVKEASAATDTPGGKDSQVLTMHNERISVPEVLFRPVDAGIHQCGVVELAAHSIGRCNSAVRSGVAHTVLLCGGNTNLPGFTRRVRRELRSLVPEDLDCNVVHAAEPMLGAWKGAAVLAASGAFAQRSVSRDEYLEHGHSICYKRFRLGGPA